MRRNIFWLYSNTNKISKHKLKNVLVTVPYLTIAQSGLKNQLTPGTAGTHRARHMGLDFIFQHLNLLLGKGGGEGFVYLQPSGV